MVEIGSATWDGGRGFRWADGAQRFETWERSGVNLAGFGAAVEQALELGLDEIGARAVGARRPAARPAGRAAEGDAPTTRARTRCAIVTASVDGVPAEDVARPRWPRPGSTSR